MMNAAAAGRVVFYHRTDPESAQAIVRDGFANDSSRSYALSLQPTGVPLRGTLLRVGLLAQAAAEVMSGASQALLGTIREYLVPGPLLRTGFVNVVVENDGMRRR